MQAIKQWADRNLQGDRVIWVVVLLLSAISILVVYSSIGTLAYSRMNSPESYLLKHTIMIVLGLFAMSAVASLITGYSGDLIST